jgi:hypothetical protein
MSMPSLVLSSIGSKRPARGVVEASATAADVAAHRETRP